MYPSRQFEIENSLASLPLLARLGATTRRRISINLYGRLNYSSLVSSLSRIVVVVVDARRRLVPLLHHPRNFHETFFSLVKSVICFYYRTSLSLRPLQSIHRLTFICSGKLTINNTINVFINREFSLFFLFCTIDGPACTVN